jgi:hypothetical protein
LVPTDLNSVHPLSFSTWVAEDWTSLPIGVLPASKELEEKIILSLIKELTDYFQIELGKEPILDRLEVPAHDDGKPAVLMIGASHCTREANILSDRGYQVSICGKPGWRILSGNVNEMVRKVKEALENLNPNDIVVVQCLDNSSFMSSTEEGGDLPIRKYNDEYHVDGDLIYVGKEKQHQLFKVLLPVLKLLEGRKVIFVVPLVRYVVRACCEDPEHMTNGDEPGLEINLRRQIAESKRHYKDFLFCAGLRGFKMVDPNPFVPNNEIDEDEDRCWDNDPVHPATKGYEKIVDALEREMERFKTGGVKRGAEAQGGQAKRRRLADNRAGWVTSTSGPARRTDYGRARGGGGYVRGGLMRGGQDRGRPYRGRAGGSRPYRGRYPRY